MWSESRMVEWWVEERVDGEEYREQGTAFILFPLNLGRCIVLTLSHGRPPRFSDYNEDRETVIV